MIEKFVNLETVRILINKNIIQCFVYQNSKILVTIVRPFSIEANRLYLEFLQEIYNEKLVEQLKINMIW